MSKPTIAYYKEARNADELVEFLANPPRLQDVVPATLGEIADAFNRLDELIAAIGNGHSSRIAAELGGIRDTLRRAIPGDAT